MWKMWLRLLVLLPALLVLQRPLLPRVEMPVTAGLTGLLLHGGARQAPGRGLHVVQTCYSTATSTEAATEQL